MTELLTTLPIIIFAILILAAIIMPLVVIMIDGRVAKIQRTLEAMEHMMRHGK